jgi:hypothetical protein
MLQHSKNFAVPEAPRGEEGEGSLDFSLQFDEIKAVLQVVV